jgi:hypothetical protein
MRTIHKNIISEENLEPKLGIEYIYNLDTIWIPDSLESKGIKKGTIVENVQQLNAGDYGFNIKDDNTKTIYRCTYGWAFIENTEDNLKLLKLIEEEKSILKQHEKKIYRLNSQLNSLWKY